MTNKTRETLLLEIEHANASQPEFVEMEDTFTRNPGEAGEPYEVNYYDIEYISPFGTRLKTASKTLKNWLKK